MSSQNTVKMNARPVRPFSLIEFSSYCAEHTPASILYNSSDDPRPIDPFKVTPPSVYMRFSSVYVDQYLQCVHLTGTGCEMTLHQVKSIMVADILASGTVFNVRCSYKDSFAVYALVFM